MDQNQINRIIFGSSEPLTSKPQQQQHHHDDDHEPSASKLLLAQQQQQQLPMKKRVKLSTTFNIKPAQSFESEQHQQHHHDDDYETSTSKFLLAQQHHHDDDRKPSTSKILLAQQQQQQAQQQQQPMKKRVKLSTKFNIKPAQSFESEQHQQHHHDDDRKPSTSKILLAQQKQQQHEHKQPQQPSSYKPLLAQQQQQQHHHDDQQQKQQQHEHKQPQQPSSYKPLLAQQQQQQHHHDDQQQKQQQHEHKQPQQPSSYKPLLAQQQQQQHHHHDQQQQQQQHKHKQQQQSSLVEECSVMELLNKIFINQCNLTETIKDKFVEKTDVLAHHKAIRETVVYVKKCYSILRKISGETGDDVHSELADIFPLKSISATFDLEKKLEDKCYEDSVTSYLYILKGPMGDIDPVFKKIFSDELMDCFNWTGCNKQASSGCTKRALRKLKLVDTVLFGVFKLEGRIAFEKAIKRCIELSHNRFKQKRYALGKLNQTL